MFGVAAKDNITKGRLLRPGGFIVLGSNFAVGPGIDPI